MAKHVEVLRAKVWACGVACGVACGAACGVACGATCGAACLGVWCCVQRCSMVRCVVARLGEVAWHNPSPRPNVPRLVGLSPCVWARGPPSPDEGCRGPCAVALQAHWCSTRHVLAVRAPAVTVLVLALNGGDGAGEMRAGVQGGDGCWLRR